MIHPFEPVESLPHTGERVRLMVMLEDATGYRWPEFAFYSPKEKLIAIWGGDLTLEFRAPEFKRCGTGYFEEPDAPLVRVSHWAPEPTLDGTPQVMKDLHYHLCAVRVKKVLQQLLCEDPHFLGSAQVSLFLFESNACFVWTRPQDYARPYVIVLYGLTPVRECGAMDDAKTPLPLPEDGVKSLPVGWWASSVYLNPLESIEPRIREVVEAIRAKAQEEN